MKKLSALLVILAIVFAVSSSYAQSQVTVHVTGGYNLPLPDFKGTYPTDSNSYFQKSGYNFGADGKYYLGKKRNVGITLSAGYNAFTSGDIATTGSTTVVKFNVITIGVGIEYAFMPKGKANPFIGAEFSTNLFSGKLTSTPTTGTATEFTLKSASRFGAQLNGGVDIQLNKSIGVVLGVKYNLANLIGKAYDSTNTSLTEYSLNDKEYTVGTTTIKARSISWIQLYGGVSFYFNRPKSMKK